ncbi:MAG: type II toxin-antitoxin system PemK/MazF family toxin [Haloferacaceae archaeon]
MTGVDDEPPFDSTPVRRGDVVIVQFNPTRGSEQRGTRPCVVVQNDTGNANAPTTIVAPCTTSYDEGGYPFEVELEAANTPLREDSVVDCSQLRTVDLAERITKNVGSIPATKVSELDRALKISLGLTR